MSPEGLDVKQYAWAAFDITLADAAVHTVVPSVLPGAQARPTGWLVTRIQVFADTAGQCSIQFGANGTQIFVKAGGCLELLPGGAFRQGLLVQGVGGRYVIEYWFQPNASGLEPQINS
ncbi:MAG TPA: hypothetical protein VGQ57_09420 [Polyangiaceae bacterium]|jgi:hypothetical protein|nr:hypothetical protein [Polyangiaceae bacterium]